jgi:hypothetical protein
MSKRSSAARQVAGSKRKRESNRRDFMGASSGCRARTAERVLHGKRRLKAAWRRRCLWEALTVPDSSTANPKGD